MCFKQATSNTIATANYSSKNDAMLMRAYVKFILSAGCRTKKQRLYGDISLAQPLSIYTVSISILLIVTAIILFFTLCSKGNGSRIFSSR